MTEEVTQTEETSATGDETVETTVENESAVETTETPQSSTESAGAGGESKPTLADAIQEGIDSAFKPRGRVEPKADEAARAEELAAQGRNPDGTFKKKEGEVAETPEEKAAREKAEADAAKKPADHINDPIGDEVKGRTRERMQKLIETIKAQETLVEQHNQLFKTITDTGASPDEFGQMVGYMRLVHSADPKHLEVAYSVLQGELRSLCIRMGKPIPEVNFLRDKGNEDLITEIKEGKISVNRAHEIAVARATGTQTMQRTEATRTAEQSKKDDAAAADAGTKALDALDAELVKRDGEAVFKAKYDILVPMLKPLFERLDPKEWVGVFRSHYDNLKVAPRTAPPPPPPPPNRQQPLRPKTPAGGAPPNKAPSSVLDAINQALEGK